MWRQCHKTYTFSKSLLKSKSNPLRPQECVCCNFFPSGATAPNGPGSHYRGFTITLRHTTRGMTPLDEGPARRGDLYRTTHNTHKRQTSIPPAGFEPTIPASERLQTHALDRAAIEIGMMY
jgi:hypothetical protein